LAVLRLVTSNLVTMDKTETRTVATFLAKEWLELVYNTRDANIQKWLPWNCVLASTFAVDLYGQSDSDKACERYFSSGVDDHHVFSIGFALSWYFFTAHAPLLPSFAENFNVFALQQMTWIVDDKEISRYGQWNPSDTWSTFSRYILFKPLVDAGKTLPIQDVLKVESHVLYVKWTTTGEIILESIIGKH
jgi:hypothetical protein